MGNRKLGIGKGEGQKGKERVGNEQKGKWEMESEKWKMKNGKWGMSKWE
jgi:hypothetical protein